MSLRQEIANTIAASLTYTHEGETGGSPILLGETRALRVAHAVETLLWERGVPLTYEGKRGRMLLMFKETGPADEEEQK